MRDIRVAIISDLHLGTYGSHAKEFAQYMSEINPEILILNGDIIDIWQFKKSYFPATHIEAVQAIINKIQSGIPVYYLTGNHNDALRRYSEMTLGNFHLLNKLVIELDGKSYWIFHGDVFDASVHHTKWIAKLGGKAYDYLIRLNRLINKARRRLNLSPLSFSKKIKASIKKAAKHIGDFEQTAIDLSFQNNYDYVVCGHIHQPAIKTHAHDNHIVTYMNSGDWVENLTSLEYSKGKWSLYHLYDDHHQDGTPHNSEKQPMESKKPKIVSSSSVLREALQAVKAMALG